MNERHRNTRRLSAVGAGLAALLAAGSARAQVESEPHVQTVVGMSAAVGGGVMGFLDEDTRDFADVGGSWEARLTVGTRTWIGGEIAYIGSAQGIDALGLDTDAILLATGVESVVRVNAMLAEIQPYALAGVGWKRYDLTRADVNTSDVSDSDDIVEVPLGVGVSYRYRGLVVDARAVARLAFDEELIATPNADTDNTLHTVEGRIGVGWEF
jgi:hypothetical protein